MIHIGTSGWSYPHWHGVLYPHEAKPWHRIHHYVAQFQTAELNSSFYKWPAANSFTTWQKTLPPHFLLSVKAPRGLTHNKRMYAPERWIDTMKRGWHELGNKCAVLLVQLSPLFPFDYKRLEYFLQCLPHWIRVAVEFRHPSWHIEPVYSLLQQYGAAYCVMSGANLPCVLRATAPFVYVRMHGPSTSHLYAGSYSDSDLHWWSFRIKEWQQHGKEVYVYFNNDGEGNAVRNALTLKHLVQQAR